MSKKPEHVFLIDGSGFIFRAYYALPPMTRPDGMPVNAVFGFIKMVMKLIDDTDAEHIAVIFDRARKTFRNDIYPDYKANRDDPPDDLIPQFALIREATRAMGLPGVEKEGFEADDLIATYARAAAARGRGSLKPHAHGLRAVDQRQLARGLGHVGGKAGAGAGAVDDHKRLLVLAAGEVEHAFGRPEGHVAHRDRHDHQGGGAQRGADLRYDLEISFEESAKGAETHIQIPRQELCEACRGSGAAVFDAVTATR